MRFRPSAAIVPLALVLALALSLSARGADTPKAAASAADSAKAAAPAKQKRHKVKKPAPPMERSAWMWGISAGYGSAAPTIDDFTTDREAAPGGNLRFGYAINPGTVLGIEASQWEGGPDSTVWTFRGIMPSVTFYPKSVPVLGKNWYFRVGAGWGSMTAEFPRIVNNPALGSGAAPDTVAYHTHDDGFAALGAMGYDWRVRKHLTISPQIELHQIWANPGRRANFANATVGLNWYW